MVPLRLLPDSGFNRDLNYRMRTVIEHSGANRDALAASAGLDPTLVSLSLSGARYWRIEEVIAVAEQARITTEWLLTGRGGKPVSHQPAAVTPVEAVGPLLPQ